MSEVMSGVVEKIHGPNKGGFYSIRIEGDDRWFGLGKFPPKCKERDTVEFSCTQRGDFYNASALKVVGGGQTEAPTRRAEGHTMPVRPVAAATSGSMSKDDYWRRKEERDMANEAKRDAVQNEIRFQASRNAAIEFLGMCIQHGLYTVPEPKGKASVLKSAKLTLDKLTDEFLKDTMAVNAKGKEEELVEEFGHARMETTVGVIEEDF